MLDVGVVLRVIGHKMVDVVVIAPPADAQASNEVGNGRPNDAIPMPGMRDTAVTRVMC